jgi:predicted transcriptional regulator
MKSDSDRDVALKLATEIVVAFLGSGSISASELPDLVRRVRAALDSDPPEEAAAETVQGAIEDLRAAAARQDAGHPPYVETRPTPAVPIELSVTPEYLVSLEDGQQFRSLRRHLMAKHGMTPDDYRRKWQLPADYPMVAPTYARSRSQIAKRIGLGLSGSGAKRKTRKGA